MSVTEYVLKIKQLLNKFIEPNCKIEDDFYYKLLDQLSGKNKIASFNLTELPIFTEWIQEAVTVWYLNRRTPATLVTSLTLNLAAILCQNEHKFCFLNRNNFYIKLIRVSKARNAKGAPCIHLAYINFLSSVLNHRPGTEWMIARNFWEDALKLSLISEDVKIIRDSQNFMKKLLKASIELDEEFCKDIIQRIMAPLTENAYKSICLGAEYDDQTMRKNLCPILQLIGTILEDFLRNSEFGQTDFRVITIFFESFQLEQRICDILILTLNKYLLFDLGRIIFMIRFLEIYYKINEGHSNIKKSLEKIIGAFTVNISKGNFDNVIKFCYFGQFFWSLIVTKIPSSLLDNIELNWFIQDISLLPLNPLFQITVKYFLKRNSMRDLLESDFIRKQYFQHIIEKSAAKSIRLGTTWYDLLKNHPNLLGIGTKSLVYLLKSRKYFERDKAIIIVQTLTYILKDIITVISNNSSDYLDFCFEQVHFFMLIFEAISMFIEDYHINWKDEFVLLDLFGITIDFLVISNWPTRVMARMLKLLKNLFEFYVTSDIAFLVGESSNSKIRIIKDLINSKLREEVEVRKSGLEVVTSILRAAKKTLPSLCNIFKDSDFLEFLVHMLTNDKDIRVTAIRCLQEMICTEIILVNSLANRNLLNKIEQILVNDPEGAVRVEAVNFLCGAYKYGIIPHDNLNKIYRIMVHASIRDNHWQVKFYSLKFWEQVITTSLENQGMINESFPNIIFCKEKGKFVNLSQTEIQKRLREVLRSLSHNGCLGVLTFSTNINYDIEVARAAIDIIENLRKLLIKYSILVPKYIFDSTDIVERILSKIVKGLEKAPISSKLDDFDDDGEEEIRNNDTLLNCNVLVTPAEFLRVAQQDFPSLIQQKVWLNGIEDLQPLLNNMLKKYDNDYDSDDDVASDKNTDSDS